jgi:hypothetical protein
MDWKNLFARLRVHGDLEALADQVAGQCRSAAWNVSHARAVGMRLAEARGYMRTKSGPVLRTEVAALAAQRPDLPAALLREVLELAGERLVKTLISDLLNFNLARRARRAA